MTRYNCGFVCKKYVVTIMMFCWLMGPALGLATSGDKSVKPQCAQNCIRFCCVLHGIPLAIEDICTLLPPKPQGESLREIHDTLEYIGFIAEGHELGYEQLIQCRFPVITHLQRHFAVVEKVENSYVWLLGEDGRREIMRVEDFKALWTGHVLTVAPPSDSINLPIFLKTARNTPRITFRTLFIPADDVPEEQGTVLFEFPFENRGSADLQILGVKSGCKCVVSYYPKHPIPPGGRDKIAVEYKLEGTAGPFGRTFYVQSNDPLFPIIELALAGVSARKLSIRPEWIDWGRVIVTHTGKAVCAIQYFGVEPFEISSASTDVPGLSVRISPATIERLGNVHPELSVRRNKMFKWSNYYVAEVQYTPTVEISRPAKVEGSIELATNLGGHRIVTIPVIAELVPPIMASPGILFFGEIEDGNEVAETVVLRTHSEEAFRVVSVDTAGSGLHCRYNETYSQSVALEFSGILQNGSSLQQPNVTVKIEQTGSTDRILDLRIPVYMRFRSDEIGRETRSEQSGH